MCATAPAWRTAWWSRSLLRRMSKVLVAFIVVMSGLPPAPAPVPPPPSAHPGRTAPAQQPAPIANPKGSASKQWYVYAITARMGTGKAAGHQITEKRQIFARTPEEAVLKQQEFINDYLHPKVRARSTLNLPRLVLGFLWAVFRRVLACQCVCMMRASSRARRPDLIP